jgi:ABC-2 type transport system ATP-binding protein
VSVALRARGLSKSYGPLQALSDVSFDAERGELLAVLGPNGAGKTTLLSILAGAQRASSGSIDVAPREVGWAPQRPALYSKLTVAENLELFARLEGVREPHAAVAAMLAQAGLEDRADELAAKLSGGNRQRVNVAIALIGGPPVLALDEPSASLDPAQRERLWEFVAGLAAAGTTVVFSTHGPGEAQRHADRVLVLDAGRLTFAGTPDALIAAAGSGERELEHALVAFLAREHRTRPAAR